MSLLTDDGTRVAVVVLMMSGGCGALLGVLLGWWLRGREVARLQAKVSYLREELGKCWSSKASVLKTALAPRPMMMVSPSREADTHADRGECGSRYRGPDKSARWMKCSMPRGHEANPKTSRHGYAGVFWE